MKDMNAKIVQVIKPHGWSRHMKGYLYVVVPHVSTVPNVDDKKYWQVLEGDYSFRPLGVKPYKRTSAFLLMKKNVKIVGRITL